MNLGIADIVAAGMLHGEHLDRLGRHMFTGVSTDSRNVRRGNLFIALRGERFDGHDFVSGAVERGAAMVIIDRNGDPAAVAGSPVAVVEDTTKALGLLANVYRRKFSLPVIAVAGSNGKTTTKEMIVDVLRTRFRVLGTEGNLNNHIGVPQTLFRLTSRHEILVLEIGTNHPGELQYLCSIAEPTHGLITNVGHEHLEFFKTLGGVAKAEGELFVWLAKSGTGFVNTDDKQIVRQSRVLRKKITYGFSPVSAGVRGAERTLNEKACGEFSLREKGGRTVPISLAVPGRHMMDNALAAATVGLTFGVAPGKVANSLRRFRPVGRRMQVLRFAGVTVLNDTYNANSDSMRAALETLDLMKCRGKKVAVLGDMLELGKSAQREHEQIGRFIAGIHIDCLLTFGPMAAFIAKKARARVVIHAANKKSLLEQTRETVSPGDVLLVKGSRGMKMEEVVEYLQHNPEAQAA